MRNRKKAFAFNLVLALVVLFFLAGCGGPSHEDLWLANVYGDNYFLYLSGTRAFLADEGWGTDLATLEMNGNSGTIIIGRDRANISVSGNTLTFVESGETITFQRSTASAAHNQINGAWTAPGGWSLYFIRDKVFLIDDDGDADFGSYEFAPNAGGAFMTENYNYTLAFTVSGNTLSATGVGYWGAPLSLTFTKQR